MNALASSTRIGLPTRGIRVEGPLKSCEGAEMRHDSFSAAAYEMYCAYRNDSGSGTTRTYHLAGPAGEVLGFVAFRLAEEEDAGSFRIFVGVNYVYVAPELRRCGLARRLLEEPISEVEAALSRLTHSGRRRKVFILSGSHPECAAGCGTLRALEVELVRLARARAGVSLIGRYVEYPQDACESLRVPGFEGDGAATQSARAQPGLRGAA